jgi:hypothetical protein
MSTIPATYDALCQKTGLNCQSITFWRTVTGSWGARAGLGEVAVGDDLEWVISRAVLDGVKAYKRQEKERKALKARVEKVKKRSGIDVDDGDHRFDKATYS